MKLRKLMVLALVLALFVCVFAACGGGTDTETNPPESDSETDAPVSDTEGPGDDTEKECEHDLTVDEKVATCTDRGYKKEICKICGETVTETAYPKAAHTPAGAATCTADSKCSVCGEVLEAAKGHTLGEAVVVEATCLADGSKTQTCSTCNEKVVEKLPALAHNIPNANVTASVAATCTTAGSKTGTCTLCNKVQTVVLPAAHTVSDLGDLSALTFADGKIQAQCSTCKATVDVTGDVRLALNFDGADVATELAEWATPENGFALYDAHHSGQTSAAITSPAIVTYPDATDGHTSVFQINHNRSAAIWFNGSVLSDAKYYVISFDWRITTTGNSSNKMGAFGQAEKHLANSVSENDFAFAFKVDRSNGDLYNNGNKPIDLVAAPGQWYEVIVVVDNESGTVYTYIDGTCYSVLENNSKYVVTEDGEYTWKLGGLYNVFHKPEFDDFSVVAIVPSEASSDVGGNEDGEDDGEEEDDGTGCDHQCYIEVVLPTSETEGYVKRTCNVCGRIVTYEVLSHVHEPDGEADCETDVYCVGCGDLLESAWGHDIPVEDERVDSTCQQAGHVTGFCVNCNETVTVDLELGGHTFTSLSEVQIVNGKVQGKCDVCGTFADVPEIERLTLNFDKSTLKAEVEAKGLTMSEKKQATSTPSSDVTKSGDRTVLSIPGNTYTYVIFDETLLKDANYYVVSFDWRATMWSHTSNKISVFSLASWTGTATSSTKNYLMVDRSNGTFYQHGNAAGLYSLTGVAKQWYTVTILVDNNSGAANVYVDGTLFATYSSGHAISGTGQYTWVFGGQWNQYHAPEFDNFKVVKLDTVCTHASTSPVEVTPATCTAKGSANEVCTKCGEILGTEELDMIPHAASTAVVSELACATVYSCAGENCTANVTVAKEGASHTVAVPTTFDATTVIKDGKIQGTCSVCGLHADAPITEDVRLALGFGETDLATEISKLNTANTNLSLSATNDTSYACTNGVLTCTAAKVLYLQHAGSILSDASYYMISFDWKFTTDQKDGYINVCGTATAKYQSTTTSFASYDRTEKTLVDGNAANGNVILSDLTKNSLYAFRIVVNNTTGDAYVYVNDELVRTMQADSLMVESGDTVYWAINGPSTGHAPQYDNFKIEVLAKTAATE